VFIRYLIGRLVGVVVAEWKVLCFDFTEVGADTDVQRV
jgi:hypothetical protein